MKALAQLCFLVASLSTQCLSCAWHGSSEANPLESAHRHLSARTVGSSSARTVIRNVRVFDGASITGPQTIYIKDGTIVNQHQFGHGRGVEVDGTGKTLIPGLIDSHLHADSVPLLETLTSYGVTTVVNMACYSYTLWAALANVPGLAAMFTATVTTGNDARGQANGAMYGMDPAWSWQPGEDPAHFVARQFYPGSPATFLKVISYPDGQPGKPTQEQYNAFVKAARDLGHYSVTHASYLNSFRRAVISQTEIIQHIASDLPLPQDLIKQMVRNGQYVTPTMTIFRIATNEPIIQTYLNQSLRGEEGFNLVTANVAALHKAGVPILAGTDSAYVALLNVSLPYGLAMHCELEFLVAAGLTPAEALRAATISPAKIQRLGNRGAIRPGMRADLVLLNSNPLVNISNTRDIARVWAGGIEYGPVSRDLSQSCKAMGLVPVTQ